MDTTLRSLLERFGPLEDREWDLARPWFQERSLKKGSFLLRPGDVAQSATLVSRGLLRLFRVVKGKETTRNIFREGSLFAESISYFLAEPTDCWIEALEDSLVFEVTKKNSEALFDSSLALSRLGRKIYEANLVALASRVSGRVKSSGRDRYLDFRRENADLFQRMPQYMIASFLGLSPEALSRIISES